MKQFFTILLLSYSTGIFCQGKPFTYKFGAEFEVPRNSYDFIFYGNDRDGIANLSIKNDKYSIFKFNRNTCALESEKVVEVIDSSTIGNSEIIAELGNNYYRIYSYSHRLQETDYLFYDKIDLGTSSVTLANQKMIQTDRIVAMWQYGCTYYKKYKFFFNADTSMMLVKYRHEPEETKEKKRFERLGLQVFDSNMNKVWGKELVMPYEYRIMDCNDFSLDYQGNVYILAKIYTSERRKEKDNATGKPGYHYEILKYTKESDQPIITSIDLEDYFIHDYSLVESSTHEMIVTFTYSNDPNGNSAKGFFLARLDQSGKLSKHMDGYYEFPVEELQKFESADIQRKMEQAAGFFELPFLAIKEVISKPDKCIFIAFEEHYVHPSSKIFGTYRVSENFNFNDIIGCKINPDGKLLWIRKIPNMYGGYAGFADVSFKLFTDTSGYYFLHLDNRKNWDISPDKELTCCCDRFNAQMVVTRIDNFGNVSKNVLFDTKEEKLVVYPGDLNRVGKNTLVGRAYTKSDEYRPIIITFNN